MLRIVICAISILGSVLSHDPQGHVSVILLGATGDLAKKYLWQGLFQLYLDEAANGHSFRFHGAALNPPEQGWQLMTQALDKLSCPLDVLPESCAELKGQFLKLSQYWQLQTAEDYSTLSQDIESRLQQEGRREAGRIFYFSVPAFAYAGIAQHINSSCRPGPGAWLRVVLEKPFGHDRRSAQELSKELGTFFREEEMYRVDHYLGKQAVAQILPFRDQNRNALDRLWNRHHVDRVEIVMKETVDAEGRISFYEEYGVIRDVIQNHLTEILMYVAMELPRNLSNPEELLRCKLQTFRALRSLEKGNTVLGQYQAYGGQVQKELQKPAGYMSLTPTFAVVASAAAAAFAVAVAIAAAAAAAGAGTKAGGRGGGRRRGGRCPAPAERSRARDRAGLGSRLLSRPLRGAPGSGVSCAPSPSLSASGLGPGSSRNCSGCESNLDSTSSGGVSRSSARRTPGRPGESPREKEGSRVPSEEPTEPAHLHRCISRARAEGGLQTHTPRLRRGRQTRRLPAAAGSPRTLPRSLHLEQRPRFMPRVPSAGGRAGGTRSRRPGPHGLLQPRESERGGGRQLAARSSGAVGGPPAGLGRAGEGGRAAAAPRLSEPPRASRGLRLVAVAFAAAPGLL
ncbi:GDH/6PGL endoplasmic bifunctional protein [Gracilinanus agilis]|uniref:GDH/6PGL endoplasmic bifunctional protein n=1 Tax=Gracilinanus agilis TaxID=191870 RepID=UPI001CFF381A|nr:GDH/6PGL endoplasmic bifunctional protein [Gracilinanus agilis]